MCRARLFSQDDMLSSSAIFFRAKLNFEFVTISKVKTQSRENVDETSTQLVVDLSIENNNDENVNKLTNVNILDKRFVNSSFVNRSKNNDDSSTTCRESILNLIFFSSITTKITSCY